MPIKKQDIKTDTVFQYESWKGFLQKTTGQNEEQAGFLRYSQTLLDIIQKLDKDKAPIAPGLIESLLEVYPQEFTTKMPSFKLRKGLDGFPSIDAETKKSLEAECDLFDKAIHRIRERIIEQKPKSQGAPPPQIKTAQLANSAPQVG